MFRQDQWLHSCRPLTGAGWRHGWSDGGGPDFKSDPAGPAHARAMTELCRRAGLAEAAWCRQVHGGLVLKARGPGLAGEADALWTDRPGLGVTGRSADCPLILLAGRREDGGRLAGFAHASWRSTVRGITASLAEALLLAGALPGSLEAVVCPSAGPCCYEVGGEVRQEALARLGAGAADFFRPRKEKHMLDLWAANRRQLQTAGVGQDRIHLSGRCTICGAPDGDLRFASYRRQGRQAGRFAAVIGF
jgi:YfiH family protein